jgi:hypothetical protein
VRLRECECVENAQAGLRSAEKCDVVGEHCRIMCNNRSVMLGDKSTAQLFRSESSGKKQSRNSSVVMIGCVNEEGDVQVLERIFVPQRLRTTSLETSLKYIPSLASSNMQPEAMNEESCMNLFKCVTIHALATGSTCLMERMFSKHWYENPAATIGVDFFVIRLCIDDVVVKMQMWYVLTCLRLLVAHMHNRDTAGSERTWCNVQSYLHRAHAVILLIDTSDEQDLHDGLERFRSGV